MEESEESSVRTLFDNEARLSWVLAGLSGLIGAAAFMHTAGYFVTFMTGNTERAILGTFRDKTEVFVPAALLLMSFLSGVVVASLCRRHLWSRHLHGPTILTTASLVVASVVDTIFSQATESAQVDLLPILVVAFGIGALNTTFVKDGEVSVPLSYVTGTLVKLGQGIERHISGGTCTDWLGYFLLYTAFCLGALLGGALATIVAGGTMLITAAIVCLAVTMYTHFHLDKHGPLTTT
ncbi:YoaK family protein [Nocardia transvalensis]|uniref:YoaK family protein n=1 Tax=Nocardia transvalensis TaxID=37333 RepID=UPI0018942A29|nr:YoaK family protein [Nocardia transvalensis]MBF6328451.1 DUF1275 domain-containing protein [Nocardia transvalensis]